MSNIIISVFPWWFRQSSLRRASTVFVDASQLLLNHRSPSWTTRSVFHSFAIHYNTHPSAIVPKLLSCKTILYRSVQCLYTIRCRQVRLDDRGNTRWHLSADGNTKIIIVIVIESMYSFAWHHYTLVDLILGMIIIPLRIECVNTGR